ncbi:Ureohydrolase [Tilletiaria anomala UBC 951]|uniref:Arginase n=1 Tax=Tilletiaria anomala (strain ATCC 24038 / CBS 436.72 / UBC 951) TaxID=1037660 RepID=A0A066WGQ1_TILAU|nr:Ureohydrolase [Tilletiaria anomala UBC 951]KDN52976.1 Ureohydrolase [Tilletiaria anomala UBC 951]
MSAAPALTSTANCGSSERPRANSAVDNLRFVKNKTVSLIGCPFSSGQGRPGVEAGPNSLVSAGLLEQLTQLGWTVEFTGYQQFESIVSSEQLAKDTPIGKMKNPRTVSHVTQAVATVVASKAKEGKIPLTLGGDHSLGLGTVLGSLAAHPDLALIWVDAHADINTPQTTDSGNLHGCPVSFLCNLEDTQVEPFSTWLPGPASKFLDPKRLVYIGLRDVDSEEKTILRKHGIKAFSMHEVDRYGIGAVVDMALDYINDGVKGKRERPIHLSFDVDALDPSVAPSTGTPVRGGLSFREGHYICEALYETGALVAMDLMEVNPSLMPADAEQTIAVGCSLVRSAFGETLL